MDLQELKSTLHQWLRRHYPHLDIPDGRIPLGNVKLLKYYEHVEIAMLELKLHDVFPEFLAGVRKRRSYLRRLQGAEFKKEQFRCLASF